MNLDNLGKRIKDERQKRGMTQEQLAEKIDISTNFMSLIENGKNMSVETLTKISIVLGVSVDYLLSDIVEISNDTITSQIVQSLSPLNDNEKLYFLNMINQYKLINK